MGILIILLHKKSRDDSNKNKGKQHKGSESGGQWNVLILGRPILKIKFWLFGRYLIVSLKLLIQRDLLDIVGEGRIKKGRVKKILFLHLTGVLPNSKQDKAQIPSNAIVVHTADGTSLLDAALWPCLTYHDKKNRI